jgi:antitoxin (DNA-binding transcriptional repressor) of toxin-antitoxin stability system
VQAGPAAQGGFCILVQGTALNGLLGGAFNQGQTYTITETGTAGVVVTAITSPSSEVGVNLVGRQATFTGANGIVAGFNTVIFTNTDAVFANLGRTAASVSVSGRIITPQGRGVTNVVVTMTDSEGNTRSTVSTTSGYYRFDEVEAGSTYVITATGKRYTFSQPAQVVNISDATEEINFIANPIKRNRM